MYEGVKIPLPLFLSAPSIFIKSIDLIFPKSNYLDFIKYKYEIKLKKIHLLHI